MLKVLRLTRIGAGRADSGFAAICTAAALAWAGPALAANVDSDINIANFTPPGGNSVGFPDTYVAPAQVDTRGSFAWNSYPDGQPSSVWNEAIGLGWGPANPMIGTQGLPGTGQGMFAQKSSTGFAFNTGASSGEQIVQSSYNLSGMLTATIDSTFTVQGQRDNQVNGGPALLSLALNNNSVNLSIESVYNSHWNIDQTGVMPGMWSDLEGRFIGDNNYYYVLVQHGSHIANPKALFAIKQWGTGGGDNAAGDFDVNGNPIWENAVLTASDNGNNTDHVTLDWNGVRVYDATVQRLLNLNNPNSPVLHPLARAAWGNGTLERRSGEAGLMASFQRIHLTASDVVTPTGTFIYWDIDGATIGAGGGGMPFGNWDGTTQNFNSHFAGGAGFITANPGALDTVVFSAGNDATGTYTVNVSGTRTAAQVNFTEGNVTLIGSGTLAVGAFDVAAGATGGVSATISGGAANGLTKSGPGTLTVSGATTYTGATNVNAGTLVMSQGVKSGGALTIADAAKTVIPATTPDTFNPPTVVPAGTNAAGSKVSSLSVSGSGQLDLNNNDMVIDHDGSLDIADIRDLIASGYNFGGQDGPGIISTTAALTDPFTFTLGYADNASLPLPYGTTIGLGTLFAGFDVDDTAALIKFTWVGDVTLDGIFDFQDLSIFNGNYDAGATTGRVWTDGDLNYDGTIDFQDLSLFNGTYDPSKPSLPEPAGFGALALVVAAAATGRRFRRA